MPTGTGRSSNAKKQVPAARQSLVSDLFTKKTLAVVRPTTSETRTGVAPRTFFTV
ncbi:hypothetical protein D3C83_246330 [compost metagenome]